MARNTPEALYRSSQMLAKELKKLDASKKAYFVQVLQAKDEMKDLEKEQEKVIKAFEVKSKVLKATLTGLNAKVKEASKTLMSDKAEAHVVIDLVNKEIASKIVERDNISLSFTRESDLADQKEKRIVNQIAKLGTKKQEIKNEIAELEDSRKEAEWAIRESAKVNTALVTKSFDIDKQLQDLQKEKEKITKATTSNKKSIKDSIKVIEENEYAIKELDAKTKQYDKLEAEKKKLDKITAEQKQKADDLRKWNATLTEQEELLDLREAGIQAKERKLTLTKKYIKEASDGKN